MRYDVIIIGAGLAGSGAAIRLARRGFAVLLLEKKQLPRHKLCGEFLSTEVGAAFDELGVLAPVRAAGARPLRRARVTTAGGASFTSSLPGTALGLSRYRLDHLLAQQAQRAGATVQQGTAARAVEGTLANGFRVQTTDGMVEARLVLGAYGKRGVLDRKLGRPFLQEKTPRVAFKAHYRGRELDDWIELHAFPGGYCGLSHVEEERVNVCWIAHQQKLQQAGGQPEDMVKMVLGQNPMLARRLAGMRRVTDGFKAVSQITFARKGPFEQDICMIGDTAAMIAPLCGDGMAMALRSAALAAPLAANLLTGALDGPAFKQRYRAVWQAEFGGRLRVGRWVHRALCRPAAAQIGVQACRLVPPLGRWLIRVTRG